jgi:hypothetical protein
MSPTRVTVTVAKSAFSGTVNALALSCTDASSLSMNANVPELANATFVALLKLMLKLSLGSTVVSPLIGTLIVADCDPAGIVAVPDDAT